MNMVPAQPADEAAGNADLRTRSAGEPVLAAQDRIEIRDYDPTWPRLYRREAARIRSLLGDQVARL
jgi:GrpB-like predicted nucleotidyltransferase (UPF0157 family)